jgi:hypothetical protein
MFYIKNNFLKIKNIILIYLKKIKKLLQNYEKNPTKKISIYIII